MGNWGELLPTKVRGKSRENETNVVGDPNDGLDDLRCPFSV
jgi:hypothetical protein